MPQMERAATCILLVSRLDFHVANVDEVKGRAENEDSFRPAAENNQGTKGWRIPQGHRSHLNLVLGSL